MLLLWWENSLYILLSAIFSLAALAKINSHFLSETVQSITVITSLGSIALTVFAKPWNPCLRSILNSIYMDKVHLVILASNISYNMLFLCCQADHSLSHSYLINPEIDLPPVCLLPIQSKYVWCKLAYSCDKQLSHNDLHPILFWHIIKQAIPSKLYSTSHSIVIFSFQFSIAKKY